jgi:hypothetical protein
LHGSEGSRSGMIYRTAAILAAHGFLAMAFPYSNGSNAEDIIDVPLDRTAEALSALRAHGLVGNRVGLYGISRGAVEAQLNHCKPSGALIPGTPQSQAPHRIQARSSPPGFLFGHRTITKLALSFPLSQEVQQ